MKFTGKIRFGGKEYQVKVENGERYIKVNKKWITANEFVEKHYTTEQLIRLAKVGKIALEDEIKGEKPKKGKYQYYAEDIYKCWCRNR